MADASRLIWHAPTHEPIARSADWFWALGILAVAAAVIAILFGNILLAVIIVLGAGILGALALRDPKLCEVEINATGIRIDSALFPYRSLTSFWISDDDDDRYPHLIVSTTSLLNSQLALPIPDEINLDQLRAVLRAGLPEVEQHESMLARLGEIFGF